MLSDPKYVHMQTDIFHGKTKLFCDRVGLLLPNIMSGVESTSAQVLKAPSTSTTNCLEINPLTEYSLSSPLNYVCTCVHACRHMREL